MEGEATRSAPQPTGTQPPVGQRRRQSNVDDLKTFIWNPKAKEFLGRSMISWAKIGLFYVIFYLCLALIFYVMMVVFYQTLDTEGRPKWTGSDDSILKHVGLGVRPTTCILKAKRTVISYYPTDLSTSQPYVDSINKLLMRYNSSNFPENAVYRDCSLNTDETEENRMKDSESCAFDLDALGSSCSQEPLWGYDTNSPCVFFKINKVIDWEPQTIQNISALPTGLQEHINSTDDSSVALSGHIWVWCESDDVELEQAAPGVPIYYFPYLNQKGYLSPLIPVRIMNLQSDVTVRIRCRAWAKNIRFKNNNRPLGQTDLSFRIERGTSCQL